MIRVEIPGYGDVEIKHVLFDYNGTLAVGGYVAAGVREAAIGIAVMGREGCAKTWQIRKSFRFPPNPSVKNGSFFLFAERCAQVVRHRAFHYGSDGV